MVNSWHKMIMAYIQIRHGIYFKQLWVMNLWFKNTGIIGSLLLIITRVFVWIFLKQLWAFGHPSPIRTPNCWPGGWIWKIQFPLGWTDYARFPQRRLERNVDFCDFWTSRWWYIPLMLSSHQNIHWNRFIISIGFVVSMRGGRSPQV